MEESKLANLIQVRLLPRLLKKNLLKMSLQKKLNGELRKEVDDFKKDMMILKNDIREKDLEIGKMMKKLQD